jgi:hypothetical protein
VTGSRRSRRQIARDTEGDAHLPGAKSSRLTPTGIRANHAARNDDISVADSFTGKMSPVFNRAPYRGSVWEIGGKNPQILTLELHGPSAVSPVPAAGEPGCSSEPVYTPWRR